MVSQTRPLPQWTWEDLEAALEGFSPVGENDPVRAHLMRGLAADAVMAQVGAQNPASGIAPRRAAGASAS
jgi:hypothetical protein